MAVKVIVPSQSYNERAFGVEFQKGVGIFEDEAEAKRIASALGYKVEKDDKPKKAPAKKTKAQTDKEKAEAEKDEAVKEQEG